MTTGVAKYDVENRPFTNPGASSFPKGTSTRLQRAPGQMPEPPIEISPIGGHFHYYAFARGTFEFWERYATFAGSGCGRFRATPAAVQSGFAVRQP